MEAQRSRGRAAAKFDASLTQRVHVDSKVDFTGYESTTDQSKVVALFDSNGSVLPELESGQDAVIALDRTPFYGESGGQVGDRGRLIADGVCFEVRDTQVSGDQLLHVGTLVEGGLRIGAAVTAEIDTERRRRIQLNHSATHLLHAALRESLGPHVQQKGSLVDAERLRFDFSHPEPVTEVQLNAVQARVNAQIQENSAVQIEHLSYDEAIDKGAMALFGEKYGSEVRVLTMGGGFSVELCGGTHVSRTGDIGVLHIVSETGIAAGIRRIEAVSGPGALEWFAETERLLSTVAGQVKGSRSEVLEKVASLLEEHRRLGKEIETLKQQAAASQGSDLAGSAVDVRGVKLLTAQVDGDSKSMLQTLDTLKSKLGRCVIVLGHVADGKVNLIAGVSKDLTDSVKAAELISLVGTQVGAKGGGRPDMARAGGGDKPDALPAGLAAVGPWLDERLRQS